jgi:CopG family nickel-responsive transcriptional regulator
MLQQIRRKNKMSRIERIGVTIEKELLPFFDELIAAEGYKTRSKAICDLIREHLAKKQLSDSSAHAVAGVFLIYDHHETRLSQRLVDLQHNYLLHVIASTHVHLSHDDCLEVIILKGKVKEIEKLGSNIAALKGVKLSKINLMASYNDLDS